MAEIASSARVNDCRVYDTFAAVYDRHWWHFSVDGIPVVESLLLPRIVNGSKILDVGCGAGQPAAALVDRGYQIVGIDGSAEMLRFARRNAPRAAFFQADARQFALACPVQAAISLSDVLNHLVTTEDLERALRSIAGSLTKEGWLLFDLNTEAKYARHWTGSFEMVEPDQVCIVRASYEPHTRLARFDATLFTGPDCWRRTDLTIFERCFADPEVRSALAAAGFGHVEVYEWQRDLDADGEPAKTFWLCQKTAT